MQGMIMILQITSKTLGILPKIIYRSSLGFKTHKHAFIDVEHIYDPKYAIDSCSFFSEKHIKNEQLSKGFEKTATIQSLTILTYNVWASLFNYQNRYSAILKIIANCQPDIICLQEVTDLFYHKLTSGQPTKNCLKDYYMAQTERNWSDTLILSKYPCQFYKQPFINSKMGRSILAAGLQFKLKGGSHLKVGVNCVHLESRSHSSQRIKQLKAIQQFNKNVDLSIIAGDFNFGDEQLQQNYIGQYEDLWKIAQRKFSQSATQQLKIEGFTMPQSSTQPNWRPDRILYKYNNQMKQQGQMKEKCDSEIKVIGYQTVKPFKGESFTAFAKDDIVRTASDHFGLFGKIHL